MLINFIKAAKQAGKKIKEPAMNDSPAGRNDPPIGANVNFLPAPCPMLSALLRQKIKDRFSGMWRMGNWRI